MPSPSLAISLQSARQSTSHLEQVVGGVLHRQSCCPVGLVVVGVDGVVVEEHALVEEHIACNTPDICSLSLQGSSQGTKQNPVL